MPTPKTRVLSKVSEHSKRCCFGCLPCIPFVFFPESSTFDIFLPERDPDAAEPQNPDTQVKGESALKTVLLRLPPIPFVFFPESSTFAQSHSGGVNQVGNQVGEGDGGPSQAVIGENCFHCLFRRVFDRRLYSALFLIFFFQKESPTPLSPKMQTPKRRVLS